MGFDWVYSIVGQLQDQNVQQSHSAAGWGSLPGNVPGGIIAATSNTSYSRQAPACLKLENSRCHVADSFRIEVLFPQCM